MFNKFKIIYLFILFFALSAFSITNKPENLTKTSHCAACGMVILKYFGTHAQVIWKDSGKLVRKFYGNISEVMPEILSKSDKVAAIYVQPLRNIPFKNMHEAGDWILAIDAFYVVNSKQTFVMGEAYISFKGMKEAMTFQESHGGKVVNYKQLKHYVGTKKTPLMLGSKTDHMHSSNMNMWMFNIMQMYMNMDGILNGTSAAQAPTTGTMKMMRPGNMDMHMTMFMAMYMTKSWSIMAMSSYNITSMDMIMDMKGGVVPYTASPKGVGDTKLIGGYNIINDKYQTLQVNGGLSFPTGRINYGGPMPMMGNVLYEYTMQMGSGTVDPILGLKYSYYIDKATLNLGINTTQRLYKNYRDYRLGNSYKATASVDYTLFSNFTLKSKIEGHVVNKTKGVASGTNIYANPDMHGPWGITYNPDFSGGELVNLLLKGNLYGSGSWKNNVISVEIGAPIYQHVNGIQMRQGWQASIGFSFMFM